KGLASRFWENIILAMLGEQFMVGEEICGVVVSIRFQEDILSIWNKTASDQVTTSRIRDTLRRIIPASGTRRSLCENLEIVCVCASVCVCVCEDTVQDRSFSFIHSGLFLSNSLHQIQCVFEMRT
uniref:Uncharacterized protein n=1 Tax=Sinocyclocheilus anshuiensis TaxID=1608454 RepID=A0A671M810_9TELE